nr:hypothetical protein [Paenibacillus wulumuqiensis]
MRDHPAASTGELLVYEGEYSDERSHSHSGKTAQSSLYMSAMRRNEDEG